MVAFEFEDLSMDLALATTPVCRKIMKAVVLFWSSADLYLNEEVVAFSQVEAESCTALLMAQASYIADGWCDRGEGGFNTEACNWDGGDCCPDTCDPGQYVAMHLLDTPN